jgi:hypothetical protein
MGQRLAIVVLSSIAAGVVLGAFGMRINIHHNRRSGRMADMGVLTFIGTKVAGAGRKPIWAKLRTMAFKSPGVLRYSVLFRGRGHHIIRGGIWMLVAMIIAVRQALDYKSTWRRGRMLNRL